MVLRIPVSLSSQASREASTPASNSFTYASCCPTERDQDQRRSNRSFDPKRASICSRRSSYPAIRRASPRPRYWWYSRPPSWANTRSSITGGSSHVPAGTKTIPHRDRRGTANQRARTCRERAGVFERGVANRFHELMALEALGTPTESAKVTTVALFEGFLEWSHRNNEASTYESYRIFLQSFCDQHRGGAGPRSEALSRHSLARCPSGLGPEHPPDRYAAVKRTLNWATDEGLIPANPLKKVKKPPVKHRDKILDIAEQQSISAAARDEAFQQLLFALENTGCRPGEIARSPAGRWISTLAPGRSRVTRRSRRPRSRVSFT